MLGRNYRLQCQNTTGQTLAAGAVVVKARRWNRDATTGKQVWEASETTLYTNAGTIATGAYDQSASVDNSTNAYEGMTLTFSSTAPASSNGNVLLYLQRSTDGGTTWLDNGKGTLLGYSNFGASGGTQVQVREV